MSPRTDSSHAKRVRRKSRLAPKVRIGEPDVISELTPQVSVPWLRSYTLMLVLSVVIATLGISLDSGAVVIGAMLVAPLIAPVLGVAGSLIEGHLWTTGRMMLLVAGSAALSIAVAWTITAILPDEIIMVTGELSSRTNPDVRDLGIALAAGAAGAYIKLHTRWTESAAGVAVAVALIPPLAVAGMALGMQRWDFAAGATLLFLTNWAAITVAALAVAVASGGLAVISVAGGRKRLYWSAAVGVLVIAFLAVPLSQTMETIVNRARVESSVRAAVDAWAAQDVDVIDVGIDARTVVVDVVGSNPLPDVQELTDTVSSLMGGTAVLSVRRAETSSARGSRVNGGGDVPLTPSAVRTVTSEWLLRNGGGRVTGVDISGSTVLIDATGSQSSPDVAQLARYLSQAVDQRLEVELRWVQQEGTVDVLLTDQLRLAADQWAASIAGVDVIGTHVAGGVAVVDTAAAEAPNAEQVAILTETVQALPGFESMEVQVRFARLALVDVQPAS